MVGVILRGVHAKLSSTADHAVLEIPIGQRARRETQFGIILEIFVGNLKAEPIVARLGVKPQEMFPKKRKIRPIQPPDMVRMIFSLRHVEYS
jgi:hypothetical protein